jgi:hypothetical protein
MNRVSRWFNDLYQRLRDRYYEGPNPPNRIVQIAELYADTHPRATRGDWIEFASNHAKEAYRAGWVRGFEWRERTMRGEIVREVDEADWEWESEVELTDLEREVNDAPFQMMNMMQATEEINAAERQWRESLIPKVDGSTNRSSGSSRSR